LAEPVLHLPDIHDSACSWVELELRLEIEGRERRGEERVREAQGRR
jgi:hypothetical protein